MIKSVKLIFLCVFVFSTAVGQSAFAVDESKNEDAQATIFGVVVKNSSVFDAQQLLNAYFSLIGQKATKENLDHIAENIIGLYRKNAYFQPTVIIKKDPNFSGIYQAYVSEPVLLSFDVSEGDSDSRASAVSFLNPLLGGVIVDEKTFRYLESALEGRLGVGIEIEHSALNEEDGGFQLTVKFVGSVKSILSISNEGTNSLGKEVISAEVQFIEQVPGFKSIYVNTFDTIKTDGYRSLGFGFNSGITKNNELLFSANISRGRYENVFDSSIPDIIYDRQFIKIGWQYQPSESNSFSNAIFSGFIFNDLTREQYSEDIDEKLRSFELGYWQQNVWQHSAVFLRTRYEQGIDSWGAQLEGPLADTNTEIDYSLVSAQLIFNQNFSWNIGLRTDIQGQYTSDNLPLSQRFTIANNSLARAFESGEINGDSGVGIKLEVSKGDDLALLSSRLVPYGYYSVGRVRDNVTTQSTTAASIGLGVRWFNRFISTYVELGKPLEEDSVYRTSSPRVKASISVLF